jgi:predicted MFS family arabinose efflux permease
MFSVQQARLITLDPALAPISMAVNSSCNWGGVGLGSGIGGLVVAATGDLSGLSWASGIGMLLALALLAVTLRLPAGAAAEAPPTPAEADGV